MSDDSAKKSETVVEMTPGDDGTKVPLTEKNDATTQEAKFVANPNGDAKIDIGSTRAFSGLNKEELMKYSDDPFWVKLRWFLFILFWVAWVAMLVMAVVIIVQAPGCEPPPIRLWVEEGAIYQVDTSNLPQDAELVAQMDRLGVESAYLPNLINENDFSMSNYGADSLIEGLVKQGKGIITDLPMKISPNNAVFSNASKEGIIDAFGNFVYSNVNLTSSLVQYALNTWMSRGVKGFIISQADDEQQMFKNSLNNLIMDNGGGVGSNVIDMKDEQSRILNPVQFQNFLEEHAGNWSYYKFNPSYDVTSQFSNYQVRLMNIAMYMYQGTPILKNFKSSDMPELSAKVLQELSEFRTHDGIKFGVVNFVNQTNPDLLGFTRVQKGTPAYAIALNFGDKEATMSFGGTPNVAPEGNVQFDSEADTINHQSDFRRKVMLDSVPLKPFEGLIIQFVANFG